MYRIRELRTFHSYAYHHVQGNTQALNLEEKLPGRLGRQSQKHN